MKILEMISQQYQILIQIHQILKFLCWNLVMFQVIILTFGMNGMIKDITLSIMLLLLPMQTFITQQLSPLFSTVVPLYLKTFDVSVVTT